MKDEKSSLAPVNAGLEQRPLSVIEYAARSGATPEQLTAMLELQVRADNHQLELMRERRRMDEEDRKLAAKLAFDNAMTQLRQHNVIVPKTKEVVQTARGGGAGPRFSQSEFDVVCKMLSPALHACGLGFRHDMLFGSRKWSTDGVESDIPWVTVICHLTHKDGHVESLTLEGPPDSSGSKNPLQEMQSTASYLKRQSILAITGTATGGEDDENKMRDTRGDRGRPAPEQDAEFERILQAGRDASMLGMKPLTEWWQGLSPAAKGLMNASFGAMRKAAALVDKGGAQ